MKITNHQIAYVQIVCLFLILFIVLALLAPYIFPDPAQQVADGYRNAHAACKAGLAHTVEQRHICEMLK